MEMQTLSKTFSVSFYPNLTENNYKKISREFLHSPVVKNRPCNAGDTGWIPGQQLRSHMPQSN